MAKARLLIVEDNHDMRRAVVDFLRDEGFRVSETSSAEQAMSEKLYLDSDVAIIDISLPGMSGVDFSQDIRAEGFSGPIIAITARDTVEDKIIGLSSGMSDYLVKPFDLRELDARINAQLRISNNFNDLHPVTTKSFRIEPKRHRFYVSDIETKLTAVEFRLMLKLMQHNHSTVHTQDLIETAWGHDAHLETPPLRIHISNLRSKIGDKDLLIIQTIPGIGYMLQD